MPRITPALSSGTTSASMSASNDPSFRFVVTQPSMLTARPFAVSREHLYVRSRVAATSLLYTSLLMRMMVAPVSTNALTGVRPTQASAVKPKGALGTWHTPTNSNDVSVWHWVLDICLDTTGAGGWWKSDCICSDSDVWSLRCRIRGGGGI